MYDAMEHDYDKSPCEWVVEGREVEEMVNIIL